jgi:hypothetical protein
MDRKGSLLIQIKFDHCGGKRRAGVAWFFDAAGKCLP